MLRADKIFVFVYRGFDHGGIETIILRLANYVAENQGVACVVAAPGSLDKFLKKNVKRFSQVSVLLDWLESSSSLVSMDIVFLSYDAESCSAVVKSRAFFKKEKF